MPAVYAIIRLSLPLMTGGEDRFGNYGKGEAFKIMDKKPTGYDVGALMYCPANGHDSIVDGLKNERFAQIGRAHV